jgi:hypothetical protein
MKSLSVSAKKNHIIALVLTWDGARWPVRALPAKARTFLAGKMGNVAAPSAREMAALLAGDQVKEIRICWVPRLKGGDIVLAEPFKTPAGKRVQFRSVRSVQFGDILGVVYRRELSKPSSR